MTTYIVVFETNLPEATNAIKEKLKTFPGYCPINSNCWAVRSEQKAVQIRDLIISNLPSGVRVFVIRSGTEAAWRGTYGKENSEWLKKNL